MRPSKRAAMALTLPVAVCALAFYFFWHRAGTPKDRAFELVSFAPADASFVFFLDARAMRASPFIDRVARLASTETTDREYKDFVRETGFDYTRDLDRLMIAGRAGSSTLAVAEGRFDRQKIAGYAERIGGSERSSGREVFSFPTKGPAKNLSLEFLNRNRIALGDQASIAALPTALRSRSLSRAMRERIERVSGATVFVVSQAGPWPEALSGIRSDQFSAVGRSLRWITVAGRIRADRLELILEGECDTTENAHDVSQALDGLRLLGQLSLSDPKMRQRMEPSAVTTLETFLKAVEISEEQQRVRLRFELSPEILEVASKLSSENRLRAR